MSDRLNIQKGRPGPAVNTAYGSVSAMLLNGIAVASKIALGEVKTIYSTDDAIELGLDEAYDTANKVRVHYHIKEFFRVAGKGKKLLIMLVAQTVSMEDMVDIANDHAKKLIIEGNGEIFQIGFVLNPDQDYEATLLNGLDADVFEAIPKAQALADWAYETNRPINVLLEGREFNGTTAAAQNLRAITNLEAENVSVIIGQDWDYADTLDDIGKKHAAIGTALGNLSAIQCNRNMGENETQNLTDATKGVWLVPGISSHAKCKDIESQLSTLNDKGYIFGEFYIGYPGVYWNDDHTCTPIKVDSDGNYNRYKISYGRTESEVFRRLRTAYLPKLKSVQPVDPATGKLPSEIITLLESPGNDVFELMASQGKISGGLAIVDPNSNLSVSPKTLNISWAVVNTTTLEQIAGTINLKTQL